MFTGLLVQDGNPNKTSVSVGMAAAISVILSERMMDDDPKLQKTLNDTFKELDLDSHDGIRQHLLDSGWELKQPNDQDDEEDLFSV